MERIKVDTREKVYLFYAEAFLSFGLFILVVLNFAQYFMFSDWIAQDGALMFHGGYLFVLLQVLAALLLWFQVRHSQYIALGTAVANAVLLTVFSVYLISFVAYAVPSRWFWLSLLFTLPFFLYLITFVTGAYHFGFIHHQSRPVDDETCDAPKPAAAPSASSKPAQKKRRR